MGQLILFPVRRRCPSLAYAQEQLAERERQLKAAREAREKAERVEYEAAALLAEARQERDEARAIASEERERIRRLRRELGETRGELDTLREAARALVAGLPGAMFQCFQCDATAMHGFTSPAGGVFFACDDHNVSGSTEMDHAPALRRLRDLTKEGR